METCPCASCFECLRQHAATELQQGQAPRCPHCMAPPTSANVLISRNQLELLLDPEDMLIYVRRQVRGGGGGIGTSFRACKLFAQKYLKQICPSVALPPALPLVQMEQLPGMRSCPHCADMVEVADDVDLRMAMCPNVSCGRPLHIEDEAAEQHFHNYSQQEGWKQCPGCNHMVEKVLGCNHMRCR